MMATVQYVTSGSGLRKFQADGFLLERVYHSVHKCLHLIVAIDTDNFSRKHSPISLCNGSTLRSVQTESLCKI